MDIKNVSLIEDALHRVLFGAYEHANESLYGAYSKRLAVADDEELLRQALFGPEGYFPNGKAGAGHSAS